MSNETVTRAQLDAAVAVARTEATAAATAAAEASHSTAITTARAEAATAERDRIKTITSLPEAAGREAHALKLALNGKLSATEAKEVLADLPTTAPIGRASESPIGLSVDPKTAPNANAAPDWDKALASRGMKVG